MKAENIIFRAIIRCIPCFGLMDVVDTYEMSFEVCISIAKPLVFASPACQMN